MLLELIIENNQNEPPTQEDLVDWADNYGLTMPVLSDGDETVMWRYSSGGLPTLVLIDHGMVLESVDEGAHEAEIDALLSKYE